ncbi:MAG TPA: YeeE/YedE thiosulfate transporter family protein [Edaphocola sp.]|nr:YeeE/YedE thiosulfate transporter family protein [Edaphocola sp.]
MKQENISILEEQIAIQEDDLQKRELDAMCVNESQLEHKWFHQLKYLIVGILFGIVFVKAEVISWFRIQEMFRLQSFHMYGLIGSAVAVGMLSVFIIKKFNVKTIYGETIKIAPKTFQKSQIYGGLIFGFGWAITGACPGPLFAQIGTGATVILITLLSAIAGTWVYGFFREKLPH